MEIVYLAVAVNEQTSVKIYSILARLTLPAEIMKIIESSHLHGSFMAGEKEKIKNVC